MQVIGNLRWGVKRWKVHIFSFVSYLYKDDIQSSLRLPKVKGLQLQHPAHLPGSSLRAPESFQLRTLLNRSLSKGVIGVEGVT